ncbi:hypothetical protein EX30DRAFT_394776 [Ascodesmis nigricans]|uniref:SAGA-associated factor 11 n=1 Tax=Ascodesmis nigricans TaxID=341454 RepID=A0A4S2N080_9PEZI|nr:hypothetical protein EX30DRAFT_394776 [Ascodesmis nigricans]
MSSDHPTEPNPASLAGLSLSIFKDLLANLTHDLVLQTHRAEKLLRTQQQQQLARIAATAAASSSSSLPEDASAPQMPSGNPLATVPPEILCPRCSLPRHTPETLSQGTILLDNGEKKKFCTKPPFHNARGHDIYGIPFPNPGSSSGTKKSKKDAMAAAAAQEAASNGDTPSSSTPAPNGDASDPPAKVGKNTGISYFKCPNCDQEKVASTRFAAHLEKCLGLAGRKSSRQALAKMSGSGSGSGSPMLLPTDSSSGKLGSRKPSPEKNGRATPVPGDDSSARGPLSAVPALNSVASGSASSTPKKKKKLSAASTSGDNANLNQPPQISKGSNPVVPILPAAPSFGSPSTSVSGLGKDSSVPPKKRKRKIENGEDSDLHPIAKPKKLKLAAASSSAVPSSNSGSSSYPGRLSPDTPKKSTPIKIKAKAASPTPSDPSLSPTMTKKKIIKKPSNIAPDGSVPIKKKKPTIGRPTKIAQAPSTSPVTPHLGIAGNSVHGTTPPSTMARKGLPAGPGSIN